MSDLRRHSIPLPHRTFAECAERLDGFVRSVKLHQSGKRGGFHVMPEQSLNGASPDEAWARNFATYGIGPQCDSLPMNLDLSAQRPVMSGEGLQCVPIAVAASRQTPAESAPMMQKSSPRERRSLLSLIFFGRR
jgi:hypothetical protein